MTLGTTLKPRLSARRHDSAVAGVAPSAACACLALAALFLLLAAASPSSARARDQDSAADSGRDEGWILELGAGFGSAESHDAYIRTLRAFDFERKGVDETRLSIAAGRRLHPNLVVGATFADFDGADWLRDVDGLAQRFFWDSKGVGGFVQGDLGLGPRRLLDVFVRGGIGLMLVSTSFEAIVVDAPDADQDPSFELTHARTHRVEQSYSGAYFSLGGGLSIMPFENFGIQLEARQTFAPTLDNELGQTHDLGGLAVLFELRLRSWE